MQTIETKKLLLETSRSIELQSQFRHTISNLIHDDFSVGMIKLLGQHARPYFSPLRAAFLFQLKPDMLSYYSPIMARDGALTLQYFFYRNPKPASPDLQIIINKKFSALVPPAWAQNILTYNFQSVEATPPRSLILVSSLFGSRQCSHGYETKIFEKFREKNGFNPEQVVMLSVSSQSSNELEIQSILQKEYAQSLLSISKQVPNLAIKTSNEIEGENLTDFCFADLNEHSFYYSDSSVCQQLSRLGASDLVCTSIPKAEVIAKIPLSFYHEILISSLDHDKLNLEQSVEIFRTSPTLQEAESRHHPEEISFSKKICSPVFESFAFDMTQKYVK